MTVKDLLADATKQLQLAGLKTARLDTLVILENCSGFDKGYLLAHPEHQITGQELRKIKNLLKKRSTHVPISYLLGKSEFYGREFIVSPAVLVPRPESETMIELLSTLIKNPMQLKIMPITKTEWSIADIGCGSGALGITAALELPSTHVELIEIDDAAIKVAKMNVIKFATPLNIIKSDLLYATSQKYDILLCNLPYVPDDYVINKAAAYEPRLAIFGGPDGLNLYRKLFKQIKNLNYKPLYILTESLPPSHAELTLTALTHGYKLLKTDDFIQIFVLK